MKNIKVKVFLIVVLLFNISAYTQNNWESNKMDMIFWKMVKEYSKYVQKKTKQQQAFFVVDTIGFIAKDNKIKIGLTNGNCIKEFTYWRNEQMNFFLIDSNIVITHKSDTNIVKLMNGMQPLSQDELDIYQKRYYDCIPKYNDLGITIYYDGKFISAFTFFGVVAFFVYVDQ